MAKRGRSKSVVVDPSFTVEQMLDLLTQATGDTEDGADGYTTEELRDLTGIGMAGVYKALRVAKEEGRLVVSKRSAENLLGYVFKQTVYRILPKEERGA